MKSKFFILTILIFGNLKNSLAQAPDWLWAKSATGGSAYGFSISADASGNSYVTGYFNVPAIIFGNDTLRGDISYHDNLFVAKYDSMGNVLWAKAPTGANNAYGNSICTDANGNSYVTGYYQGSGIITFDSLTLTNGGPITMFVVKYNNNGNVVWAKNAVADAENRGNAIGADEYGNVYVTGIYDSSITLDGINLLPVRGPDIFLAKYDSSGNVIWAKSAGGHQDDTPNAISTDANGNCYITGNINFNGYPTFFDTIIVTGSTMFVAKYDSSGRAIWAKGNEGFTSSLYSNSISHDMMGNSYITGYFYGDSVGFGNSTLINTNNNFNDIFVVKYNNVGNVVWGKSAGTPDYDEGMGISTDANGNSYVTGFFKNFPITFGSNTLFNSGYIDSYVVKYESSGNVLWAKSAGGDVNDNPGGISINANGNCFITGYSGSSTIAFDAITLTNTGSIFLSKTDGNNSATGINTITNNFICNIYPNPSEGVININLDKSIQMGEVNVYNMIGKKVYSAPFIGKQKKIEFTLSPGIYFMKITDGNEIWSQKFILR